LSLTQLKQVKGGMSHEEVSRIVGVPPGDYSSGRRIGLVPADVSRHYETWLCDDGQLFVYFDGDVVTEVVVVTEHLVRPPTLTERIGRWLGL
jgi:hypothetical protein